MQDLNEQLDYYLGERFAFGGAGSDVGKARVVMFGVPLDATTSFKPGTRFGPNAVREASLDIEEYVRELGVNAVERAKVADVGSVWVSPGNIKGTLERLAELSSIIAKAGKVPFALGGEHTCTAGLIAPFAKDCVLVHFDAHADLHEEYRGDKLNHTSAIRRCIDAGVRPENIIQVGVRSLSKEEHDYVGKSKITELWAADIHGGLKKACGAIEAKTREKKVYVSFDLDVMDCSLVPATGTPEPGGLGFDEACALIGAVKGRVVGCDIMETARDAEMLTQVVAAKLIYRMLASFDFG
ncbi:agmatinase [Candidatus Micrarchaeota archaeon]|nr:agmatinase [Candidatus Micrarchaeota archaeon]